MVDGISSSLAGLQNATQRISNSARNIANASTGSGGNLDGDIVEAKLASIQYEANVKTLKVQLDTEKSLLDILA